MLSVLPPIKWLKAPAGGFDFLTFEEADRLIAGAESEWRAMIIVALRTGLRHGELIGLRWIDVDLDAGRLVVRQAVSEGVIGTPKNGRMREVPLCKRCHNPWAGTTGSTARALAKADPPKSPAARRVRWARTQTSTTGRALPSMTSSRHIRGTWKRPAYESRTFSAA
jgi:hypothetical protein